ncbi:MAG: GbsR/MarR family transcriptional regulator [Myxococcota bacterium]
MPEVEAARERAVLLVADSIGELMRFWNFKPSMGKIWTVLYLSQGPLDAEEIERRAQMSAGMVSMTLQELLQWGVVKRVPGAAQKKRLYVAETDILAMVARVFRERELRLVSTTVEQLEEALRILETEGKGRDPQAILQSRFLVTRVSSLLALAKQGRRLVERLAKTGSVDLTAIRGVLAARR